MNLPNASPLPKPPASVDVTDDDIKAESSIVDAVGRARGMGTGVPLSSDECALIEKVHVLRNAKDKTGAIQQMVMYLGGALIMVLLMYVSKL